MFQISIVEYVRLNNPITVDIRSNYAYNMGHINGAISVPYYNLLNNYSHYLNRYSKYYLYCESGDQSLEIAKRLNSFGYDVVSIMGGYQEYLRFING